MVRIKPKDVTLLLLSIIKILKVIPKDYSAILESINKCTSKEIADEIAKDFCYINTKKNRQ